MQINILMNFTVDVPPFYDAPVVLASYATGSRVTTNAVQIIPQLFVEIEKLSDLCLNNNMNNCLSAGIS